MPLSSSKQFTQGANLRNPKTKFKRSKNVLSVASVPRRLSPIFFPNVKASCTVSPRTLTWTSARLLGASSWTKKFWPLWNPFFYYLVVTSVSTRGKEKVLSGSLLTRSRKIDSEIPRFEDISSANMWPSRNAVLNLVAGRMQFCTSLVMSWMISWFHHRNVFL